MLTHGLRYLRSCVFSGAFFGVCYPGRSEATLRHHAGHRDVLRRLRRPPSPAGTATDEADYVYLVTSYYDGTDTRAVRWDDVDLAVPWPIPDPILSERDQNNPSLRELLPEQFPP